MLQSAETPGAEIKPADTRGPGRPRCDATRQAILKAAYDLLAESGLAGFTIEAVAARSGAAKTTIYRWWSSKGALAMAAVLATAQRIAPLPPENGCTIAELRAHLHMLAGLFSGEYGRVIASIIAEGQGNPEVLTLYRKHILEPRGAIMRQLLQRGVETGVLVKGLDIDVAIDLIYGGFYARLLVGYARLDDEGWVDRLVDRLLHGIVAPES